MKKYKTIVCALAFSLCSLISYAGFYMNSICIGAGIGNDRTCRGVSFEDEVSLSQKKQPTPNRVGWFKKAPRVGDIRYRYRIAKEIPAYENSILHPEKFLCKVYATRESYVRYTFDDTGKGASWLPMKRDEEVPNLANFIVDHPAFPKPGQPPEWTIRFKKGVNKNEFNDGTVIITTNKPFIQGSKKNPNRKIENCGYWPYIIEKINTKSIAPFEDKTLMKELKPPKNVKLKFSEKVDLEEYNNTKEELMQNTNAWNTKGKLISVSVIQGANPPLWKSIEVPDRRLDSQKDADLVRRSIHIDKELDIIYQWGLRDFGTGKNNKGQGWGEVSYELQDPL